MNISHLVAEETEMRVLGTLLFLPEKVQEFSNIDENCFYSHRNKSIYKYVKLYYKKANDELEMLEEIEKNGHIDECGGYPYISTLAQEKYTSKELPKHCGKLEDFAAKRKLYKNISEIYTLISQPHEENLQELKNICEEAVCFPLNKKTNAGRSMREAAGDIVDALEKRRESKPYISTGFLQLDWLIRGFKPGQLIYLAARTSQGKTTFCLNLACNIAKERDALFFSLEIKEEDVWDKAIASIEKIQFSSLEDGRLTTQEGDRVMEGLATNSIYDNIYIHANQRLTMSDIKTSIRSHILKKGKAPIVFVDYLTLIKPSDAKDVRRLQIEKISAEMKEMALEFDTAVVALCQLNREPDKRAGNKPLLSDLKESGSLEQDADLVLLINREDENSTLTKITIAKNRNGRRGEITLNLRGEFSLFEEVPSF